MFKLDYSIEDISPEELETVIKAVEKAVEIHNGEIKNKEIEFEDHWFNIKFELDNLLESTVETIEILIIVTVELFNGSLCGNFVEGE